MILRALGRLLFSSSGVTIWRAMCTCAKLPPLRLRQLRFTPLLLPCKFVLNASSTDDLADRRLFEAIKYGQNERLQKWLVSEGSSPNLRHPYGWALIHAAVINRNKQAVKMLIDCGADLNIGDEYVNLSTTSKLKKANPMTVYKCREDEFFEHLSITNNFRGFTPLHYAVLADDDDIVGMLLQAGADPLQTNEAGHRPSAYALPDLQQKLLSAEKKAEDEKIKKLRQERRKYPIEKIFKEKIVGQEDAIKAVASVIRRKESGWCSDNKPLVLLFLGSSGVGKTELAKQMANYLHGDQASSSGFVRIDMSEYQEKHEVSKFIGAPPGYVGYQEGGQLTEALQKNPNAVVLLDEVDKAHTDVLTIMLQLFDEGRLTDGKGKTIDGSKAVYVMTANLGNTEIASYAIRQRTATGKDDVEISRNFKESVMKPILKRNFRRDEFLGRINEIVYFLPFSGTEIKELVTRELDLWAKQAERNHHIKIDWDSQAVNEIASAYDVTYGARSIKHEVDRVVISLIARAHEEGLIDDGSRVRITVKKHDDKSEIGICKVHKSLFGAESLEEIKFSD